MDEAVAKSIKRFGQKQTLFFQSFQNDHNKKTPKFRAFPDKTPYNSNTKLL